MVVLTICNCVLIIEAIWNDYNPVDGTFETIHLRKPPSTLTLFKNEDLHQHIQQRAVRHDDGWDVIRKPTMRPTPIPTKYPSEHPTVDPTNYPSRHPTKSPTKKPTKHPTVDEDEILDHLIATKQASTKNIIKLYAADSFYLMDDLEKELLSKNDFDALILRNPFSQNPSKQASSKPIAGYYDFIDDAFHRIQGPLRNMVSLGGFRDFDKLNHFVQSTIPKLEALPDIAFHSCKFKNKTQLNALIKAEYPIIADMLFYGFLDLLDFKILHMMNTLNQTRDFMAYNIAQSWITFANSTKYTMHRLIPQIAKGVHSWIKQCLLSKNMSTEHVLTYQRSIAYILYFSELIYMFTASIDITQIVYNWKYVQGKQLSTIHVAVLSHECNGKKVTMESLLNALGYEIERYQAKLIEHKNPAAVSRKHAKRSKKSLFNIIPYQAFDVVTDFFVSFHLTHPEVGFDIVSDLDRDQTAINILGVIKIYIVAQSCSDYMEKELLLKRGTDTVLVQDMRLLESKEVTKDDHLKKKMSVIAYFDEVDNTFAHLRCFLGLLSDQKLNNRDLMHWTSTAVWNMCKLGDAVWKDVSEFVVDGFYNRSAGHRQIIDCLQEIAANSMKYDTFSRMQAELSMDAFAGLPATNVIFEMALIGLHAVGDIKLSDYFKTIGSSKYSQSEQFPKELAERYGHVYSDALRQTFVDLGRAPTHEMLNTLLYRSYQFELFKGNFDIGRILYNWMFTSGSIAIALPESQVHDPLVNVVDVLSKLGYEKDNIHLIDAIYEESSGFTLIPRPSKNNQTQEIPSIKVAQTSKIQKAKPMQSKKKKKKK